MLTWTGHDTEWATARASRYCVTLRCPNSECPGLDEHGRETWPTVAVSQYGVTEYQQPMCTICGTLGEEA